MEMLVLPEINESNGKLNMARTSARTNIPPKMALILFVGMSCFGNILAMISLKDSLPMYLYSGFCVGIIFCWLGMD